MYIETPYTYSKVRSLVPDLQDVGKYFICSPVWSLNRHETAVGSCLCNLSTVFTQCFFNRKKNILTLKKRREKNTDIIRYEEDGHRPTNTITYIFVLPITEIFLFYFIFVTFFYLFFNYFFISLSIFFNPSCTWNFTGKFTNLFSLPANLPTKQTVQSTPILAWPSSFTRFPIFSLLSFFFTMSHITKTLHYKIQRY